MGKYVLKSFSQYDPEYLKKKLAAAELEGSSTTEESEGTYQIKSELFKCVAFHSDLPDVSKAHE